ncbi:hypothetical protein RHSIM_Rhsim10G0024700 [Rhododendron simsii]|uniref:HIG1 domain-containing protein n=1 Tax=Rhododendron simsii TaxID=118357 RepID=A0A834G900_RHOSS|nr:hypothetical protein RHSIM_Rhsim10G0024700 [Rhododendron simsii]
MEKMGATNSELEGLFEQKKRVKNPLVPIEFYDLDLWKQFRVFFGMAICLVNVDGYELNLVGIYSGFFKRIPIEQRNVSHVTQAALEFLPIVWLCMIIDNYGSQTLLRRITRDDSCRELMSPIHKSVFTIGTLGAFITAGVLTAGLISFRMGNSQLGQHLMRARVVAQGATVALMVSTAYYYGEKL